MRASSTCAGIVLLWFANATSAAPFEVDVVETDDVRLIYLDPFQTHLVPHVLRNVHNSLAFQKRVFGWQPYEKPTIVLTDLSDYGNAGAFATPYNSLHVFIAPTSRTLETNPSSERIFMFMNHETVHLANLDVANRQDLRWRRFFGGKPAQTDRHPESILYNYLAVPRLSSPRWYFEGAAVFMETWMAGGVGRAQGAYDEMVFRSMVRDDAHFYSNLGLASEGVNVDFQHGVNAYLYGTRFISYLAQEYSPERVVEWLSRGEGSARYYSKQFAAVFGKPLDAAWGDWIAFEHAFQRANLEQVRRFSLTEARRLTPRALGSMSRAFVDTERNELVGAFRFPGVVAHVGAVSLPDGTVRRITDIKGPMTYRVTSPAWDPASRTLFFTADNTSFRDLMAVNVDTRQRRMLLKDARIGDIVFDATDQSLLGLRHENGYVSLVRIPPPYKDWKLVFDWPYGEAPSELDLSHDGRLLSASVGEIDGSQHLRVYRIEDLQGGQAEPVAEFDFTPAVPEGFVFSPDSRYLYGSSYYTGVSNIFRFEIETSQLEAMSNAETGFFRPIPQADGSLIVFEYTGQGFVPAVIEPEPRDELSSIAFLGAEIAQRHPVVRSWNVIPALREVRYEDLVIRQGKYRPYRELAYDSGYPVIEGYRDTIAGGWYWQFADPAQFHRLGITASYSPDGSLPANERLHLDLKYEALNWHARYWHNSADFYDLFGPTERAREGDAFIVGYDRALIYDDPRRLDVAAEAAYYTGLDTLPANQNVSSEAIDRILSLELGLHYSDTRESLGSVDHEKGWRWDAVVEADDSDLDTVAKPRLGLDFGFALPWRHSSVWLYNAAGRSSGDRSDPLGNFYFGGFGNNYVDDGAVKRYREYDSFPGFEIDELSANDFVKTVVEWNLPPVRFRAMGRPGFYLGHLRPAVFFGALVADPGDSLERTVTTVGAQLDLSFTLAHRLPMTISLGYAAGYEDGDRRDTEWMASLKIL
jgi:hypothetical protein